MATKRSNLSSRTEYLASYGKEMAPKACGQLENMYIDYLGDGEALESIPGFRKIYTYKTTINAIHPHSRGTPEEGYLIHAGTTFYSFRKKNINQLYQIGTSVVGYGSNTKSSAVEINGKLYIFDGKYIQISNLTTQALGRLGTESAPGYIPTTYVNGERNEERNLLSNSFIEKYTISTPDEYLYSTPGLCYKVLDESQKTCAVVGGDTVVGGRLEIPYYATICNKKYRVTKIEDRAFRDRSDIITLITSKGLREIGHKAFYGCKKLQSAAISDGVERIGTSAFGGCEKLLIVYLGTGLKQIGEGVFSGCSILTSVNYAGEVSDLMTVEGYTSLNGIGKVGEVAYKNTTVSLPIHAAFSSISSVTVGGEAREFSTGAFPYSVFLAFENESEIIDREIVITGVYGDTDKEGFLSSRYAASTDPVSAITNCSVLAVYDNRLFISGNTKIPGVVFYSARGADGYPDPTYFPVSNYFVDGAVGNPVVTLLNTHGTLTVHKTEDGGIGSIFHHSAINEDGKDTYPITYVHSNVRSYGPSINFNGEAFFISDNGVSAIEKTSGGFRIAPRARSIRSELSKESMSDIRFGSWQGYLVLMCGGGRIYLGDARSGKNTDGEFEYSWFPLTGIGTYKNDERVYRYSPTAKDGYDLSDTPDDVVTGTVMSVADENGDTVYYVESGGKKITVYPTEELVGGEFYPVSAISTNDLLILGTSGGDLILFNSDKRGAPPARISSAKDFDATEYAKAMSNKIHPDFYDFAGHAPCYTVSTALDSLDTPHMRKSTVSNSLVIECASQGPSGIVCYAETDRESQNALLTFSAERFGFDNLDFSTLSFASRERQSVRVPDATRIWTRKRVTLHSKKYRAPISVYSINYRYKIDGGAR